jgi:hypothetical protein
MTEFIKPRHNMAKRPEPVRKTVKETLDGLLAGHREAAFRGPETALKYLRRTFAGQMSLPNAVKAIAYDLTAEAEAQCGKWDACAASVAQAISHLPELEEAYPHEYRKMLLAMTSFARGIQAHNELGNFPAALALCDQAVALALGAHFIARRDSLEWAR